MNTPDWHHLDTNTAAHTLDVDPACGLDEAEAATRLAHHGPNQPRQAPGRSTLARLVAQFTAPLVLILIVAGVITAALGEYVDSAVIFGVVVINALVGFVQEGKAEAALAALARAIATHAIVVRNSARQRLDAVHLVPGDIVWLAAGDRVPADLRLLTGHQLRTVEAALTGESAPIDKHTNALPLETLLADRRNMLYAGTHIVSGQGLGLVVATGETTATGRISRLIADTPSLVTPLTRKIGEFAQQLVWVILALAALTFAVGVARGEAMIDMLMAAVALAVGAIPEGLPAAMTITLAIGVGRMAKRRAIIRHLPAVETLGSVTVICSNKTGTLTENAMTVTEIWAGGERFTVSGHGYVPQGALHRDGQAVAAIAAPTAAVRETLLAGALCNDATLTHAEHHWQITGDPTEAALLVAARKGGLDETTLRDIFPRRDELPFDAARQSMATLHEVEGQTVVYVKGAVEKLLPAARVLLDAEGKEMPLDHAAIENQAIQMAQRGLRVLALARRTVIHGDSATPLDAAVIGEGLTLLGLVGMIDPPRPRAITAVRTCHAAGIRVKMITGDHADTARAIARQIGIANSADAAVLTGRELAKLSEAALAARVCEVDVFARVEPEQKLRLVRALQDNGEVVAMTGDGVNDAPALKAADIGIAMGEGGTEVAKEAAAMVLTDDNFATIEAAVEEGRGLYDNLVKFITWTLPTNLGEGLVILAAILAGVTLPITPLQILWINMTTAVLLGLPLAFEPAERGIMRRPPRPPGASILDRRLVTRVLLVGVLMLLAAFGLFELALARGHSLEVARTVAVNAFVIIEMAYLFNCRSLHLPITQMAAFSNPWVWWGAGLMLALQLALTYWLPLASLFGTAPIDARAWGEISAVALAAIIIVELEKRWLAAKPSQR
ncbi:MAG TPA: HAD-IC family P-type ATPase [Rugosibacter sp.]|nr:HAD-IC family P-type ATPase [Rugosibacter sp.]HQQ35831.1 HAD-IC family P-type ATPase [Rugosibacter sp.]